MQVGEWANNQGQSNAPTDPSDRMGMLLFAATHIQELSTESDDGQSPGTPKGPTVVRGKLVSSDQKRKIYQTQATIRRYSDGHQVQQQVKDINASPNIPRKRTVCIISVIYIIYICKYFFKLLSYIFRQENHQFKECVVIVELHVQQYGGD